jgi:hypothetical protein
MIMNVTHRRYGTTVSVWVQRNVPELENDAVSLSSIIFDGKDGFNLAGSELDLFIGMCIGTLMENEALPVIGGGNSRYDWIHQPQYGSSAGAVTTNVIAEWKASGVDPDLGGLWFARPDPANPSFVKIA